MKYEGKTEMVVRSIIADLKGELTKTEAFREEFLSPFGVSMAAMEIVVIAMRLERRKENPNKETQAWLNEAIRLRAMVYAMNENLGYLKDLQGKITKREKSMLLGAMRCHAFSLDMPSSAEWAAMEKSDKVLQDVRRQISEVEVAEDTVGCPVCGFPHFADSLRNGDIGCCQECGAEFEEGEHF